jgi:L-lactate dehydrogenase complex protein LldG
VEGKDVSARDGILSRIRARRLGAPSAPPGRYRAPVEAGDPVATFAERAGWVHSEVRILDRMADVPAAVAELLRAKNLAASVHLPPDAELSALPWGNTLTVERDAPGPDDCAIATAPFAIAETGTLVYPARADSPAAWHFRAGFEVAVLRAGNILPQMEDTLARIKETGPIPHTINFVSGPSRTGDIEQTLELGAHGPKALAILIVRE